MCSQSPSSEPVTSRSVSNTNPTPMEITATTATAHSSGVTNAFTSKFMRHLLKNSVINAMRDATAADVAMPASSAITCTPWRTSLTVATVHPLGVGVAVGAAVCVAVGVAVLVAVPVVVAVGVFVATDVFVAVGVGVSATLWM